MNIVEYAKSQDMENPHEVSARKLLDTERAQAIVINLKPGQALRRHITPVSVFFYVLDGVGEVEIGDECAEVVRDMLIESPARIPHRLMNNGDADFRFLVVKTPRPSEQTKLL